MESPFTWVNFLMRQKICSFVLLLRKARLPGAQECEGMPVLGAAARAEDIFLPGGVLKRQRGLCPDQNLPLLP